MLAIFRKEIQSFFNSPIGYLIVGLFLLLNGLFLWVFKGNYNVFDNGFADLENFFHLVPWVFIFLIPAITMRSFSEERKMGTLELLYIKPLSTTKVILGKFWGALVLCSLAVLPTIVYVFCISALGMIEGNYDSGIIIGSYFGLLFLIAAYVAIGLFCSSFTDNQIVAFILGTILSFSFFYGFEALSTLFSEGALQSSVENIGAKAHFESIAEGILDSRDLVYFSTTTLFFLYLTQIRLKNSTGR